MVKSRVLLLDVPSLGISPLLTRQIFEAIGRLKAAGPTILLVEQMADRARVLERGRIVLTVKETP